MHVEDSTVPCGSTHGHSNLYEIHVYNESGVGKSIETTGDVLVCKLRVALVNSLYPEKKMGDMFKLISVAKRKILAEGLTLFEEEIGDNDVLLLLPSLSTSTSTRTSSNSSTKVDSNCLQSPEINLKGPSEIEIWSATANLPAKHFTKVSNDTSVSLDFQKELRKILVSLIDFTAKLLKNNAEVRNIVSGVESGSEKSQSEAASEGGVDETALEQLVDMGFSAEKARRALILNNMSPIEAMDWLLAYESTQIVALPPQSAQGLPSSSTGEVTGAGRAAISGISHSLSSASSCTSTPKAGSSRGESVFLEPHPEWVAYYDQVPAIVESYRTFKRKSFRPNVKALNNLKKMSFPESLVLDALWIHANNEVAACEWLLSDRRPLKDDLRRGLSVKSPIYRAIINDPTIQLGLLKPRIFYALLQLLEEPNSMSRLLNDTEISSVLSQIFRLYNSEKHLAITSRSRSSSISSQSPLFLDETVLEQANDDSVARTLPDTHESVNQLLL